MSLERVPYEQVAAAAANVAQSAIIPVNFLLDERRYWQRRMRVPAVAPMASAMHTQVSEHLDEHSMLGECMRRLNVLRLSVVMNMVFINALKPAMDHTCAGYALSSLLRQVDEGYNVSAYSGSVTQPRRGKLLPDNEFLPGRPAYGLLTDRQTATAGPIAVEDPKNIPGWYKSGGIYVQVEEGVEVSDLMHNEIVRIVGQKAAAQLFDPADSVTMRPYASIEHFSQSPEDN